MGVLLVLGGTGVASAQLLTLGMNSEDHAVDATVDAHDLDQTSVSVDGTDVLDALDAEVLDGLGVDVNDLGLLDEADLPSLDIDETLELPATDHTAVTGTLDGTLGDMPELDAQVDGLPMNPNAT